ncbi:MAG: 50S ribosomal protein L25, partial [Actinomycetota bacterium]
DIEGTNHLSVVKDIQRHPTRRDVLHVDFLRVTEDQLIDVAVPVVLIGEARNVTMYDGMVDQTMYEMTISVTPTAVPQQIEIDISELELGSTVKVEDVDLPEGATSPMDPNETVAIALITRSTREAIRRAEQGEAAEGEEGGEATDAAEDADGGGDEG